MIVPLNNWRSLAMYAGNVTLSLVMSLSIPLTIWAFTFPWPYLEPAPLLGANFIGGASVLMIGLLTYHWAHPPLEVG